MCNVCVKSRLNVDLIHRLSSVLSYSFQANIHKYLFILTLVQSKGTLMHLSAFRVLRCDNSLIVCVSSTPLPGFCPLLSLSRVQLRRELQDCSQGLKSYAELLRASEKSLYECRENLRRSQRKCSEKTETFRQLQAKVCTKSCSCP